MRKEYMVPFQFLTPINISTMPFLNIIGEKINTILPEEDY